MNIDIKFSNDEARYPTKGSIGAAGYDLASTISFILESGDRKLVPTGIHLNIPENHVGLIWPRSKLANKFGIIVGGGVIDSDYRGEIHVILINSGKAPLEINIGDHIAQIIFQEYKQVHFNLVNLLDESVRNDSGITSENLRLNSTN